MTCAIAFCRSRTSDWMRSTRSTMSSGLVASDSASVAIVSCWRSTYASAAFETTASMRRTPLPIEDSPSSTNIPSSPVVCACVPPQNSTEGPNFTTRTTSPYFSPAIVTAPVRLASSIGSSFMSWWWSSRISSLTRCVTARFCSLLSAPTGLRKSNRMRSTPTHEPACTTSSPSTSLSARCKRWAEVWWRRISARHSG